MSSKGVPTTSEGLHTVAALAVSAVRVEEVVQILLASGSIGRAANVTLDIACAAAFLTMSAVVIGTLLRRRTPRLPRLASADVALMCLLQLAQIIYAPTDSRYSTWDAWAYGVSPATMYLLGLAYASWAASIAAGLALTACYAAAIGPSAFAQGHGVTVVSNGIGLFLGALIVRLAWNYFRRMASDSDELSRIRQTEAESLRHTLHDQNGVLGTARGLAMPGELAETIDHAISLGQSVLGVRSTPNSLGAAVRTAVRESGVVTECVTSSADHAPLPAESLECIGAAVRTLLINVQRHARASLVNVRAEVTRETYEVSVSDDGVGFDTTTTQYNYGLRHQVHEAMTTIGAHVEIVSSPGFGTTVIISGRREGVS